MDLPGLLQKHGKLPLEVLLSGADPRAADGSARQGDRILPIYGKP